MTAPDNEVLVARLERFTVGGVLATTVLAIVLGVEPWRAATFVVVVAIGTTLPFVIRRRSRHVVRDLVLLAALGLSSTTIVSGGLEAPWLVALVTMSAAAAALLEPRHARFVLGFVLAVVVVDVAIEVFAWHPFDAPPPAYDRAHEGPGRLLAVGTFLGVVFVAMLPGGAVVRATLLETARAVELESLAKAETVASLEARSLLLSRMTDALADELAAPLERLCGRLEALKRASSGVDLERLAVLARETERFAQLLPRSGARRDMTIAEVVEEVVASHHALAETRGVTLAVAGTSQARVDAQALRQILVNLVQNAIEASPVGAAVDVRIDSAPGPRVVVEDRGGGLAPEAAGKLFSSGFTTKPGGNGIGLVVARALAERLGGTLALEPRDGGGCRATLCLPDDSPWRTRPR